ncbi:putative tripartite motif-containing protein 61 [Sorex fumeus]|uniref:putative tripartite motif-containing protein 61 n=1 Tax=Sorex fumeus TaxID=62283 RepID=UPI0024AE0973|nr:putative tripartite motif-containing protein 61 [Sorex fumeus]XP_055967077.1 putative tripartite motif-containing protein 61 [Sorex fumeus]
MAFEAFLAELHAEACCPLCMDYFRDPVTLDCGHNFCDSCIRQRWEDLEDVFPCPICLHHCRGRKLRKNYQLCNLTDSIKQLPIRSTRQNWQEEEPLCEKHNEIPDLFCEEDLEPEEDLESEEDLDHHLIPTERAAVSQERSSEDAQRL